MRVTPALPRKVRNAAPQVTGLEHSGSTFEHVRDLAELGLACFIGNSHLLLPGLSIGATRCTDGPLDSSARIPVNLVKHAVQAA